MTSIGLLLPTRETVIYGDRTGDPRPLIELAVRAEQAGFDSVWAGDSLLARPRAEPLTLLAGVATQTTRVELGTAVLLASLRNPAQLAQAGATLDALSGGRFILGVGAGPDTPGVKDDHKRVGADFQRRASHSIDVIGQVRSLWRGEGEQMYPLPATPGGPPVWIGGSGPRTLERTGQVGDGWFPTATSAEAFASGLVRVRAVAEEAGRDPGSVVGAAYLTVVFGERDDAERQLAEHSQLYYGVPHEVIARQQGSIAGPVDMVTDWLSSFVDAGATHLCLRIGSAHVDEQFAVLADLLPILRR